MIADMHPRPSPLSSRSWRGAGGEATSFHFGYRPALDGLRGVAALMVMVWHFHVPGFPGGFLGVDVFFVLSGFLITSLLVEEWRQTGTIGLRRFYVRRALRLLPALFLLLLVTAPFVSHLWTIVALGYVANWALAFRFVAFSPISHVWSLSIEEHFYFLWPILFLLLLRRGVARWKIVTLALVFASGSAALKVILWTDVSSWLRLYHGSDARADGLLLGCAIALLVSWQMLPRGIWFKRSVQIAAVVSLIALARITATVQIWDAFLYRDAGLTLVALAVAFVILQLVLCPIGPLAAVLAWRPLVAVGRISYGLYLWHHPISYIPTTGVLAPLDATELFVFRVLASFAVAIVCYRIVEQPMLRLKHRFSS